MLRRMPPAILVSGGAGYIGSHAAYALKQAGYAPVVIDNLSTGNAWAASGAAFEKGDISDEKFVRNVCQAYRPEAALHFAAFIEVGESVQNPAKYFDNNRDKAKRFFDVLRVCGVDKIVFSSTAAVYGAAGGDAPLTETAATNPVNPYGQSKLEAETYLRGLDGAGMRSVTLRYFNVAGAAPAGAGIGEAHAPETHLIPRLVLPLIGTPPELLRFLGLQHGFTVYGDDYPTPDGTAIRDYIHVMDLIDAHLRALDYLQGGGGTDIFNLGSGKGFSVGAMVEAARAALDRPDFTPGIAPRRAGDPPVLVAGNEKAGRILGWRPSRTLRDILNDATAWHRSPRYRDAIRTKSGL
jgi:UDP-glucose-4-epimerase GalE